MPIKPTQAATWATDTNYTGGAEAGTPTKVAPSAGRQAEGVEPGAKYPAQEFNWEQNLVGQWTDFIRHRMGRVHTREFVVDADVTQSETGTGVTTWGIAVGPDSMPGWSLFTTANADRAAFNGTTLVDNPCNAKMLHILEYEVDSTDLTGTPALTMHHGFRHDLLIGTEDTACFAKTSASANWFARTSNNNVATETDTGIAATGVQRFTIMWWGATISPTAAQKVEYYIDGALVATNTANLPAQTSEDLGPAFVLLSTGATDDRTVRVSPVKYYGVRYLAP